MQLLDFSARLIKPHDIIDAGYGGVIGYFSDSRPGANFGAKPLRRDYCDRLRAAGLEVVTNYQFGKGMTSDWRGGYDAGVHHARIALRYHFEAGGPAFRPLYAPVDDNPTLQEWNELIAPFLRGWASVVGLEWTGMYGNSACIDWALEDGVARWFWQHNWGTPRGYVHPEAHLHQFEIDKRTVGGVGVDLNNVLRADYGQWSAATQPAVTPPDQEVIVANKPDFEEIDYYADSNSDRWGARVTNGLGHTQEGGAADGSGAQNLADYLSNLGNGVSYHDVIGAGHVFHVAPKHRSSWSVLDANPYTINYCLAGSRAGWTREQWMQRRDDIRIMAWLMVADAQHIGYDTAVIAPPYVQREGLSDHRYVTDCLGFGTHTDMGRNFPWDVLADDVAEFATGTPAGPPPNAINDVAAATPWLGARITAGEESTPDGLGRFAAFEHGHVYWHPSTGAHAISAGLFGRYGALGFETGVLGYPITASTELEHGRVQGFQGGALYCQDGRAPVVVRGAIRARWHREGSENGPFGYPVADETQLPGGEAVQRFEHGQIIWPGRRDTAALLDSEGPDTPVPDRD